MSPAEKNTRELQFTPDPKSGFPYDRQIILQTSMLTADRRPGTGKQLLSLPSPGVTRHLNPLPHSTEPVTRLKSAESLLPRRKRSGTGGYVR